MRVEEAAAVAQAPAHVWAEYFSHVLLNESLRVKFSHLDANFWTKSRTQFIFSGQNLNVLFLLIFQVCQHSHIDFFVQYY